MQLTEEQIKQYHEDGYLVLPGALDVTEVTLLDNAFNRDSEMSGDHRITEGDGMKIRAIYASHQRQAEFGALVRDARILGPVQQLLIDDVYVYQFKINAKPAFGGAQWAWHQDFVAWRIADNLPAPRQVNVGVFLDEMNEFNGPVIFVRGSHRNGLVRDDRREQYKSPQHIDPDDIALAPDQVTALVRAGGMVSPKGPAGSVLFFHPEIVHGSAPNMSPFPRRLLIITYNDVTNPPQGEPRPEYLVGRDTTPLEILDVPFGAIKAGVAL